MAKKICFTSLPENQGGDPVIATKKPSLNIETQSWLRNPWLGMIIGMTISLYIVACGVTTNTQIESITKIAHHTIPICQCPTKTVPKHFPSNIFTATAGTSLRQFQGLPSFELKPTPLPIPPLAGGEEAKRTPRHPPQTWKRKNLIFLERTFCLPLEDTWHKQPRIAFNWGVARIDLNEIWCKNLRIQGLIYRPSVLYNLTRNNKANRGICTPLKLKMDTQNYHIFKGVTLLDPFSKWSCWPPDVERSQFLFIDLHLYKSQHAWTFWYCTSIRTRATRF